MDISVPISNFVRYMYIGFKCHFGLLRLITNYVCVNDVNTSETSNAYSQKLIAKSGEINDIHNNHFRRRVFGMK